MDGELGRRGSHTANMAAGTQLESTSNNEKSPIFIRKERNTQEYAYSSILDACTELKVSLLDLKS